MKNNQIKIFVILLAILITLQLSVSEATVKTFVQKIEGVGHVIDAIQTTDGNFLSVSRADGSRPYAATYIVRKVTPLGKMIWERTLSDQVDIDNSGYWILQSIAAFREGYVLVGEGNESDPGDSVSEAIVVALYSDGTVNWTKRLALAYFGGKRYTGFDSVASTPDGGFIVRGHGFEIPSVLVKFAPDGSIQWQNTFSSHFRFLSTCDNGSILAGRISNGADIVKVDNSGNNIWSSTLTMEDSSLETLGCDPDHGIVIVGKSKDSKILSVIRLDSSGRIQWKTKYSLEAPFLISHIVPTVDGGYALTGGTNRNGFVLKINAQRRLVFQRAIDVQGSMERALSIFPTSEGGFILFGSSGKSDLLFLSLNSDGLIPDCRYFHNLNSKAVGAGVIKIRSSNVSSQLVTLHPPRSFDVKSKRSRHFISTICQ